MRKRSWLRKWERLSSLLKLASLSGTIDKLGGLHLFLAGAVEERFQVGRDGGGSGSEGCGLYSGSESGRHPQRVENPEPPIIL